MGIRDWPVTKSCAHRTTFRGFRDVGSACIFVSLAALLAACGVQGDPQPPRPQVPAAITDVAVRQAGDGAVLTFTPPRATLEGEKLEKFPDLEIFRGYIAPEAKMPPSVSALRLIYTVPSAVVDTYLMQDRVEFTDALKPDEVAAHSGQRLVYLVRTRVSKKQASPDSNVAGVVLYPAPQAVSDLHFDTVEAGVSLAWTPPLFASGGRPLVSLSGYRIYRSELETLPASFKETTPKLPPALVGVAPSPSYLDERIEWGRTYSYSVRSVAQYPTDSVESADSNPVQVTPRDIFPPEPPRDLVAVYVPSSGESPANVELSWAISTEPDLAGYNVYRNGQGTPQARLNRELLLTPTFRDMSVIAGEQYTYTVTAVDRTGNESRPSTAVAAVIPKPGE